MEAEIKTVGDVPEDYTLVEDHARVMKVLEYIDVNAEDYRHGHLFVRTEEGDYGDVLWFKGLVPYTYKLITRLL